MNYSIGRAGFFLVATMVPAKKEIRAELYIDGTNPKVLFRMLRQQKADIERELGYPLEWEELPSRRACRVSTYLRPADADDRTDWARQHQWLATRLNELHRALAQRVRTLDAEVFVSDEPAAPGEDQTADLESA